MVSAGLDGTRIEDPMSLESGGGPSTARRGPIFPVNLVAPLSINQCGLTWFSSISKGSSLEIGIVQIVSWTSI